MTPPRHSGLERDCPYCALQRKVNTVILEVCKGFPVGYVVILAPLHDHNVTWMTNLNPPRQGLQLMSQCVKDYHPENASTWPENKGKEDDDGLLGSRVPNDT